MLLMERIKRIDRWCDMLRSAGITLCFVLKKSNTAIVLSASRSCSALAVAFNKDIQVSTSSTVTQVTHRNNPQHPFNPQHLSNLSFLMPAPSNLSFLM